MVFYFHGFPANEMALELIYPQFLALHLILSSQKLTRQVTLGPRVIIRRQQP